MSYNFSIQISFEDALSISEIFIQIKASNKITPPSNKTVTKIHFSPYNLEGKEKKMDVESFIAKGKFRVTTSCISDYKNRTSIGR